MRTTRPFTAAIFALLLVPLALTACAENSAQRIAQYDQAVQVLDRTLQTVTGEAEQLAAGIQAAQDEAEAAAADGDTELLGQINAYLDTAMARLTDVLRKEGEIQARIDAVQARIDDIKARPDLNIGDEMELIGGGIRDVSGALPSPANWIGILLGSGIAAAGGVYGRRKRQEADSAGGTAKDLVRSIDRLLDDDWQTADEGKAILKSVQDRDTRDFVRDVKS